MAGQEGFSSSRMKDAMDELAKSEGGRELADQLRSKLKELNDKFKGLTGDDKTKFLDEFREKFSDSLGDLKDALKINVGGNVDGEFRIRDEENESTQPPMGNSPQPNYMLFLLAIVIILLVFG